MGQLRDRMIRDMQVKRYSPHTQKAYRGFEKGALCTFIKSCSHRTTTQSIAQYS